MRALKLLLAIAMFGTAGVSTAADDPLEVTIKIVESPNDAPKSVTKTIQLPPSIADKGREQPPPAPAQSSGTVNDGTGAVDSLKESVTDQVKTAGELREGIDPPIPPVPTVPPVPPLP